VRNVRAGIVAGLAGSGLGAVTNLLAGAPRSAAILAGFLVLDLGCLWLLRRGRVIPAATGLLLAMIATIHGLGLNGDGIHDTAALLYPVAILVAAFTLDRRLLVATTLLCFGSVLVLAEMERRGALRPNFEGHVSWGPLADVAIVLLVTGVAAHILLADAGPGLAHCTRASADSRHQPRDGGPHRRASATYAVPRPDSLVTVRGFPSYVERDAQAGGSTASSPTCTDPGRDRPDGAAARGPP
jgi:hypothetical protein